MANENEIELYHSRHTGTEIDDLLDGALQHEDLTQAQYDNKKRLGQLVDGRWYCIYGDSRKQYLQAVYVGKTLMAQKSTEGSTGFPYSFPIIFG